MKRQGISILMAAAECTPLAKVGGLGDVLGSLPAAVAAHGADVSVILPKYGSLKTELINLRRLGSFDIRFDQRKQTCAIYTGVRRGSPVRYYFVEHRFFKGKDIYTSESHAGYSKGEARMRRDIERFSLFSQAVVEAVHQLKLPADLIHCHDWHTGLIPTYADQVAVTSGYRFIPTVFTIHNLPNQGAIARTFVKRTGLRAGDTPSLFEDYHDADSNQLNLMKLGILGADRITTVSPTYAKEIMTTEYGAGMESFLKRRSKDLSGILNGIDTDFFDPASDRFLKHSYSAATLQKGKAANKSALRRELGLPESDAPLFGFVGRLVAQKGCDLLIDILPELISQGGQCVILGSGEPTIERALEKLSKKYADSFSVNIGFNEALAHRIYAASDYFLMPSLYEPCGLGQMIAMRYGTIPVVRKIGGLADTVLPGKTGFVFGAYTDGAFAKTLTDAYTLYGSTKAWYTMASRCMRQDFSWRASAAAYVKLYHSLT